MDLLSTVINIRYKKELLQKAKNILQYNWLYVMSYRYVFDWHCVGKWKTFYIKLVLAMFGISMTFRLSSHNLRITSEWHLGCHNARITSEWHLGCHNARITSEWHLGCHLIIWEIRMTFRLSSHNLRITSEWHLGCHNSRITSEWHLGCHNSRITSEWHLGCQLIIREIRMTFRLSAHNSRNQNDI